MTSYQHDFFVNFSQKQRHRHISNERSTSRISPKVEASARRGPNTPPRNILVQTRILCINDLDGDPSDDLRARVQTVSRIAVAMLGKQKNHVIHHHAPEDQKDCERSRHCCTECPCHGTAYNHAFERPEFEHRHLQQVMCLRLYLLATNINASNVFRHISVCRPSSSKHVPCRH